MRLSYSTGSTYSYPLARSFHLAHGAGLDCVELVLGPEAIRRGPAEVQRLAEDAGVSISSLHGPILPLPGWRQIPRNIERLTAYAAALEPSPLVVLHVPQARDMERDERGRAFREALASGLARDGLQIAVETPGLFHTTERAFELFDMDNLGRFAERMGAGIVLDTVHVASLSQDILHAYGLFQQRLANVHLSDLVEVPRWLDRPGLHSLIKHHQIPGRGVLPLAALVQALARDGYEGLVTLELSPVALRAWSATQAGRALREAVAYVQGALSADH